MIPLWLHVATIASLVAGVAAAALIALDEWRRPQKMAIMNLVWPIVALFGTLPILAAYVYDRRIQGGGTEQGGSVSYGGHEGHSGRKGHEGEVGHGGHGSHGDDAAAKPPFPFMVVKGALHCGSGCVLGDIIAETLAFAVPAVTVLFGWHWLFGDRMYAAWVLDYLLAYAFGIVFQFFTIAPMRGLGVAAGLWAAVKADTLSLTAWQVGMYGFMGFASLYLFPIVFVRHLDAGMPEFWFAMQIEMMCGLLTSYPVNWWLIRVGLKEAM